MKFGAGNWRSILDHYPQVFKVNGWVLGAGCWVLGAGCWVLGASSLQAWWCRGPQGFVLSTCCVCLLCLPPVSALAATVQGRTVVNLKDKWRNMMKHQ